MLLEAAEPSCLELHCLPDLELPDFLGELLELAPEAVGFEIDEGPVDTLELFCFIDLDDGVQVFVVVEDAVVGVDALVVGDGLVGEQVELLDDLERVPFAPLQHLLQSFQHELLLVMRVEFAHAGVFLADLARGSIAVLGLHAGAVESSP